VAILASAILESPVPDDMPGFDRPDIMHTVAGKKAEAEYPPIVKPDHKPNQPPPPPPKDPKDSCPNCANKV
jgi:hypothetical protein